METASEGHEETAEAPVEEAKLLLQHRASSHCPHSQDRVPSPALSSNSCQGPLLRSVFGEWGCRRWLLCTSLESFSPASVVPTDTKQAPQTSATLTDELGAFSPAFAPSLSLLSGRLFSLRHRQTHHWGRGRGVGSWGLRGPAQGINPRVNSAPGGGG